MASSRVSYDEYGNMLIDGVSLSVRANSYKISDSFKNAIKDIELQFKNAAISEEQYYSSMEKLRDAYLEKGTKEWWSYTNKLVSFENKMIEAQKKALEEEMKNIEKVYLEIASTIYKTQNEIEKEQQKFAEKMSEFAGTSQYIKQVFKGVAPGGGDLVNFKTELNDLDAQKETLKEYYNLLMAVRERGYTHFGEEGFSDFFDMLRDYSVEEGSSLLKTLLKENDAGFLDFVGDWNDIQKMSAEISKEVYKDDTKKAMEESLLYMKETLTGYGLEIPEGFFESGALSAEKFGEGFCAKIDGVLSDISAKFDDLLPKGDVVAEGQSESTKGNVFAPVYNLYGSGETIAQKLRSAAAQALVDRLRGGY